MNLTYKYVYNTVCYIIFTYYSEMAMNTAQQHSAETARIYYQIEVSNGAFSSSTTLILFIFYFSQHMMESQVHAQQYHSGRFGEMDPVPFTSKPEIKRPTPYYIREKARTNW